MQAYCHRCGEELPAVSGETTFCPHCGAPQLRLALENQSAETSGLEPDGETTGTQPPPLPSRIVWATAIRCALLVAGIGAVLSLVALRVQVLSPVSFVWIMSASLITMALYQRRLPAAWMDVAVGARIGVVVGLCLALGLGATMAGWGLIARFALHSMAGFDAQMAQQVQKAIQQSTTPIPQDMIGFIQSPEFRAGVMLAGFAFVSVCLTVLSTVGGAFAGLLRARRGHPA